MELAEITRVLWIHRVLALIGAPFVIALVLVGTHRVSLSPFSLSPTPPTFGVATARVLVDTPASELVDLGQKVGIDPTSMDAMSIRVGVMADELAGDEWRARLAVNAGLRPEQLDISPFGQGPSFTSSLARRLGEVEAVGNRPYVVRLTIASSEPIVTIATTAPTAAEAARLAQATTTTFSQLVDLDGRRGFVARPLGAPRAGQFASGSRLAVTAILVIFALGAWLVGIVLVDGIARARRRMRPIRVAKA